MTMDDAARPQAYTCGSITVLETHEAVRLRPGMYIGDTQDGSGLHNLAREVIDDAVDHHVEDRCFRLAVTIHAGGALTVENDGPGIPVEALELVLTRLHCFERSYRTMTGVHGVGLAAVNALCEQLVAEVHRGARLHRLSFRRGTPDGPITNLGRTETSGIRLTLHPDPLIFSSTVFDGRRLLDMLRPIAFLHPGLRIDFADERPGGHRATLHGRGIAAWVALLGEGQDGFPAEPLRLRAARNDLTVDVALHWTRGRRSYVRMFANDHEVHGVSIVQGIAKGVKEAARRAGTAWALRGWDPQRLGTGLAAIADLRGPDLEVVGCCRDELADGSASVVRDAVAARLVAALERRPEVLEELSRLAT